uniref:Uncharacterized protein n=1 Tax=Siphoviridae sp. ctr2f5 TaxID=2825684 RepID=A0A8S5QE84_9CAUD|nr:MAG TPA: hypothetical protein [Siphoviridae sp. ctr2f5]
MKIKPYPIIQSLCIVCCTLCQYLRICQFNV